MTILVNGLPLVHAELKRRGVAIRKPSTDQTLPADSFWAASGLFSTCRYSSSPTAHSTKYYSNTTRASHVRENAESERRKKQKDRQQLRFTSFWADGNNRAIAELADFTKRSWRNTPC
ncbi:hypothetical protein [Aminivibrio sp.]|uniref:type I restriction endonuclease n=1 Tax=Aminivibrio sp. TaxID=1872489 RepID=UPI00345E8AC4